MTDAYDAHLAAAELSRVTRNRNGARGAPFWGAPAESRMCGTATALWLHARGLREFAFS